MATTIPRSHQRSPHSVPIRYALLDSERFHPTRTYDFSTDGLCYETHRPIDPGTHVCIVMENYSPGLSGPEGFRSYVATVCWNQLISSNGTDRYATGARFVTRSHDIIAAENQLPHHMCDLCGAQKPLNKIELTQSGAQLCSLCIKHYHCMPAGKIRQCVERFLIGNVL
jgi:hypothetical protein